MESTIRPLPLVRLIKSTVAPLLTGHYNDYITPVEHADVLFLILHANISPEIHCNSSQLWQPIALPILDQYCKILSNISHHPWVFHDWTNVGSYWHTCMPVLPVNLYVYAKLLPLLAQGPCLQVHCFHAYCFVAPFFRAYCSVVVAHSFHVYCSVAHCFTRLLFRRALLPRLLFSIVLLPGLLLIAFVFIAPSLIAPTFIVWSFRASTFIVPLLIVSTLIVLLLIASTFIVPSLIASTFIVPSLINCFHVYCPVAHCFHVYCSIAHYFHVLLFRHSLLTRLGSYCSIVHCFHACLLAVPSLIASTQIFHVFISFTIAMLKTNRTD